MQTQTHGPGIVNGDGEMRTFSQVEHLRSKNLSFEILKERIMKSHLIANETH